MGWKRSLLTLVVAASFPVLAAQGATLYFDTATGIIWDNGTTADWSTTSGGTYDQPWAPGDAVFEGTAGTVNVTETITGISSLGFSVPGYTLGGGTLTLTGTPSIDSPGANTISSILAGSVGWTKTGNGTLTLGGVNTYTGVTTISAGTLKLNTGATLGATGAGNGTSIASGATLDIFGQNLTNEQLTVAGTITNTGASQSNALRTVTLAGDAIFTGTGRWDIRGGSASLNMAGFKVSKTGTNKIAFIDGTISGGGTIEISAGTFGLTRSSMTTGAINVLGGTLEFENNSAAHNYAVPLALSGGKILSGGADGTTYAGNVTLTGTRDIEVASNRLTMSGSISGAGGIRKLGIGTLVLTSSSNSYAGSGFDTELAAGTLAVVPGAIVGDGTNELDFRVLLAANPITLRSNDANTLTLGNFINISSNVTLGSATTGAIVFTGAANGGGAAKTFAVDGPRVSFNGVVAGNTAAFTKAGLGVLEFNNPANTFTKPVIVDAGGLGGTGLIPGAVTINAAGTLMPGNSLGTLTISNSLALNGTALFELEALLPGLNPSDRVVGVTALTYGGNLELSVLSGSLAAGQSWDLFDFAPLSFSGTFANDAVFGTVGDGTLLPTLADGVWQFDYSSGVLSIAAIPEPGTIGLTIVAAACGLMFVQRRRKAS